MVDLILLLKTLIVIACLPAGIHCYSGAYITNASETMTYSQAELYCRRTYGTELATITSSKENDFVQDAADAAGIAFSQNLWIGLTHTGVWNDGTPVTYTNWINNSNSAESSDSMNSTDSTEPPYCVDAELIVTDNTYKWRNISCDALRWPICNCELYTGPIALQSENMTEANEYCESNYSTNLAFVENDIENTCAYQIAYKVSLGNQKTWLGLYNNENSTSDYLRSVVDGSLVTYTHWDINVGEPNRDNENCVEYNYEWGSVTPYRWNDGDCSTSGLYFICDSPPRPTPHPTTWPSNFPSAFPSAFPSTSPSDFLSSFASFYPSLIPSSGPTMMPSLVDLGTTTMGGFCFFDSNILGTDCGLAMIVIVTSVLLCCCLLVIYCFIKKRMTINRGAGTKSFKHRKNEKTGGVRSASVTPVASRAVSTSDPFGKIAAAESGEFEQIGEIGDIVQDVQVADSTEGNDDDNNKYRQKDVDNVNDKNNVNDDLDLYVMSENEKIAAERDRIYSTAPSRGARTSRGDNIDKIDDVDDHNLYFMSEDEKIAAERDRIVSDATSGRGDNVDDIDCNDDNSNGYSTGGTDFTDGEDVENVEESLADFTGMDSMAMPITNTRTDAGGTATDAVGETIQ